MSRTILADVDGFTPIIDTIVSDLGLMTAVVFGRIWRYCQMEDKVCNASLEKIGDGIGVDKATVMRHAKALCDAGYLKDLTPDLRNHPHTYSDTGKAGLTMSISGVAQRNVENDGVADSNAPVAQSNTGVAESKLKKDIKKESKKEGVFLSEKEIEQANRKVDAIISNSRNGDFWNGRETFHPDHFPYVDWYHQVTGQVCSKSKRKDWHMAVTNWAANGLAIAHLQAAYDMDIKWRGVFISPNQLTDKAIAIKAQKQTSQESTKDPFAGLMAMIEEQEQNEINR